MIVGLLWASVVFGGSDDGDTGVNPIAVQRGPSRYHRGFERLDNVPAPSPVPEPTPVPTPEPLPSVPEPTLVRTGLEGLIISYDWDDDTAIRIAYCESGGRPDAISWTGESYGLWQINSIHASRFAGFWEAWSDPVTNTQWAWELYQEQGWAPWLSSAYCWR